MFIVFISAEMRRLLVEKSSLKKGTHFINSGFDPALQPFYPITKIIITNCMFFRNVKAWGMVV